MYVKISWTTPFANYDPVKYFILLIKDATNNFIEVKSYCDGAVEPIFTNQYCLIPMNKFWPAPLSLAQDTMIQAKVISGNNRGSSEVSNQSTTTLVQVETKPY